MEDGTRTEMKISTYSLTVVLPGEPSPGLLRFVGRPLREQAEVTLMARHGKHKKKRPGKKK